MGYGPSLTKSLSPALPGYMTRELVSLRLLPIRVRRPGCGRLGCPRFGIVKSTEVVFVCSGEKASQ